MYEKKPQNRPQRYLKILDDQMLLSLLIGFIRDTHDRRVPTDSKPSQDQIVEVIKEVLTRMSSTEKTLDSEADLG